MQNAKTIFFTGPRPMKLCGYSHDNYKPLVQYLTDLCEFYYQQGYTRYITGGAQGFDQLAFWAVHNITKLHDDVENIVYVPFKGQERNWLKTGAFSQHEYNLILKYATKVVYLQDELSDYKDIAKALFARNHTMANDSDLGIALYQKDDWDTAKGGTAECIQYAVNHNKPVYQLRYQKQNNQIICNNAWNIML